MALTRDRIVAQATKPKLYEHHVPAWADESGDDLVYIREMTADEAEAFQEESAQAGDDVKAPKDRRLLARTVRPCIVNPDGSAMFPDEADVEILGKLQFSALNGIGMKLLRVSGITEEGADDIGGNSSAGQTGETESTSPESTTTAPTTNS